MLVALFSAEFGSIAGLLIFPLAATIGSISSMEVNVDLLDQMELVDVSDQETLDVFFSSGGEEGLLASPLPGMRLQMLPAGRSMSDD